MNEPKRGKRVQIYLPADLLEQWERTPRYERSSTVASALRAWWAGQKVVKKSQIAHDIAQPDDLRSDA